MTGANDAVELLLSDDIVLQRLTTGSLSLESLEGNIVDSGGSVVTSTGAPR
ncbi:MAG: hypothetical protein U5O39_19065 [Gammaproteobacteria bacterium]|nr:hypothetical protein [Gammaproteobacteria bacterium]